MWKKTSMPHKCTWPKVGVALTSCYPKAVEGKMQWVVASMTGRIWTMDGKEVEPSTGNILVTEKLPWEEEENEGLDEPKIRTSSRKRTRG